MTEISNWFIWILAIGFIIEGLTAPIWVTVDRPKPTAYGAAFSMLCNLIFAAALIGMMYLE